MIHVSSIGNSCYSISTFSYKNNQCGCTFFNNHISIIINYSGGITYLINGFENYIFLCWWLNRFMQIYYITTQALRVAEYVCHSPWMTTKKGSSGKVTIPLRTATWRIFRVATRPPQSQVLLIAFADSAAQTRGKPLLARATFSIHCHKFLSATNPLLSTEAKVSFFDNACLSGPTLEKYAVSFFFE